MLDPCENSYRCWGIQLPSVSWPARLFEQAAKTRSLYAAFKKLAWQKRKRYKEEVHFIQLCVIFFFLTDSSAEGRGGSGVWMACRDPSTRTA